jgi:hypothetical protein
LVITVGMLGAMALAQTPPEEPAVGEPGQTEAEESPEAPTSQPVAEEEEPKSVLEALLTGERATGDWGGARPWLEECGVTFDMTLTTFFQSVAHADTRPGQDEAHPRRHDVRLRHEFLG